MEIPKRIHSALMTLGILDKLSILSNARSFEEAQQKLKSFQEEAKKSFKDLSRKYHPDLGGDEEQMKALSAAYDEIKKIRIQPPQPQPIFRVIYINTGGMWSHSSTSTTTTTVTGWY